MTTRREFITLGFTPTLPQPRPWRRAFFRGRYAHEDRPYFDRLMVTSPEPMEGELVILIQQCRGGAWYPYEFPKL